MAAEIGVGFGRVVVLWTSKIVSTLAVASETTENVVAVQVLVWPA